MEPNNDLSSEADEGSPTLTDGLIVLRCLEVEDAPAHLAGEDEDQIRWLSGGADSLDGVVSWIKENRAHWKGDGPRRNFGVRNAKTGELIGNCEANVKLEGLGLGEVNISYVVFPKWRGKGVAQKAVLLLCEWLRSNPEYTTAVIRIAPDNRYSHLVPVAAGFTYTGPVVSPDGEQLIRYELPLHAVSI